MVVEPSDRWGRICARHKWISRGPVPQETLLVWRPSRSRMHPPFACAGLQEALEAGWNVEEERSVCSVDLPLQAGLSSSSAMVVVWMQALARVADVALTPHELARWAHKVEVAHFGEPGGHMDHVASALGGIHRIHPDWRVEPLDLLSSEGVWIVVDSVNPKTPADTCIGATSGAWPCWRTVAEVGWTPMSSMGSATPRPAISNTWQATWRNMHSICCGALEGGRPTGNVDVGASLSLRDGLGLSTLRLESQGGCHGSGRLGRKVVGSGGGCALVWCLEHAAREVHQAARIQVPRRRDAARRPRGLLHALEPPQELAVELAAGRSSRINKPRN